MWPEVTWAPLSPPPKLPRLFPSPGQPSSVLAGSRPLRLLLPGDFVFVPDTGVSARRPPCSLASIESRCWLCPAGLGPTLCRGTRRPVSWRAEREGGSRLGENCSGGDWAGDVVATSTVINSPRHFLFLGALETYFPLQMQLEIRLADGG